MVKVSPIIREPQDFQQSDSTEGSLNSMDEDISSMQSSIYELSNKVNSWESAANEFSNYDSKLAYYDSRLQATDNQLSSLQNSLSPWDSRLAARISQLDSAYNSLATYLTIIQQVKATSTGSTYDSLTQVEAGIIDSMNQISSARSELSQMRSELSSMLSQIQSARNEISSSRSDIAQTRQQLSVTNANMRRDINDVRAKLADSTAKLGSARDNIANARNSLGNYGALADSMSSYLMQSANEIDALLVELSGTESLLRNAKQNIDKFISEDPQSFVPTKIETLQEGRKLRAIDSMFPSLIGLVSMLSCLLLPPIMSVKQRSQGIRSRMKLSYASPFSIIVGKFLGDYLVGLVQVFIVTLLGSLVFGIYLGSNFSAVAMALFLAPAVFTSMGTLLASFVSKEGSAVLSTLLFSMPMLFLSGILLPIEQIHGSVRTLTEYLPLYNIVEMISKVTIRDAAAYTQTNFEIGLAYLGIFLFLAYFAGRNAD
ncbi:MAG: ABC transporter permease [Candidatus Micrarchaeota archaeon]